MVHFKPTSVLFAIASLIAKNVVAEEAHALDVFPELKGTGPFEIAYNDPETHKVVVEHVDENGQSAVEKRTSPIAQDHIANQMRNHNGYGFCKDFCPACQSPKPVTKTDLKTSTKFVTVTTAIVPAPTTITLTATGAAPADSTVLQTTTISETATKTFSADPSTVTNVETTTSTSSTTTVLIQTSTLSFPSAPTMKARNVSPPSWLKGVANNLICPACTKVWPAPAAKTVSVCKTTTVTRTRTQTSTAVRATVTSAVTVTPVAKTITAVISTTVTLTSATTVTPITTQTLTSTSTISVIVTSTTTSSVCPQQTANVNGIQAVQPGTLRSGGSTANPSDCCLACFNDPDGCTQWAYLARNFCFYSVPGSGLGSATALCPNGKGNGALFTASDAAGFGGPGQCAP